jgi:hypothetical protein
MRQTGPPGEPPLIAVLPFENLSAAPAPLKDMRLSLIERLRKRGVEVLGEEDLEPVMARHRVRYTGGIDRRTAEAFRQEAGAGAVLITSLGLYMEQVPPKVVVASRLAGTGISPNVTWADSVAMAGDDAPGLLELGLVDDVGVLSSRALDRLADSLARHILSGEVPLAGVRGPGRFRPRGLFRAPALGGKEAYTIAVLPVVNHGERRNAGELLALHFVEQLGKAGGFEVLEPGVVREELLRYRVVAPEGTSLDVADILFSLLGVDLLLTAKVVDYDDALGSGGAPQVTFFVQVIEGGSREVVWASHSTNRGDEGVFFFDLGRVTTAHALASRMVREVVMRMKGTPPEAAEVAAGPYRGLE